MPNQPSTKFTPLGLRPWLFFRLTLSLNLFVVQAMKFYITPLVLLLMFGLAEASPVDDLASPDPSVRATAAEQVRKHSLYRPTSRARWNKLLTLLKKGDTIKVTLGHLEVAGVLYYSNTYLPSNVDAGLQLDDSWALEAFFHDGKLVFWHLFPAPRLVDVPPPPGYTGTWMVYRLDGSPIRRNYRNSIPMPSG